MRAAAAAVLIAGAVAAGCGGDKASAEDTVSDALIGVGDGDAPQVCERLTAGAQRMLLAALADNPLGLRSIHAKSCEEAVGKLHAQLPRAVRDILREGEVEDAVVDGDRATVVVTGAGMTVKLRKIDDDWMITGGLLGR